MADINLVLNFNSSSIPTWLKSLGDSNFFAALFGAFFGAWAAGKIADRSREREELLREIRISNTGIALAGSACSSFLNIKFKNVRDLKPAFEKGREEFRKDTIARSKSGVPVRTPRPDIEVRTFRVPQVNIEHLEAVVLDKLSAPRRAIAAVGALKLAAHTLQTCTDEYWNFVTQTKDRALSYEERAVLIYGLASPGRIIDTTVPNMIDGIVASTDSCIYFSQMLCSDLTTYGQEKRAEFVKRFRGSPPEIETIIFPDAEAQGLIPSGKGFETWNINFAEKVPETKGRLADKVLYRLERIRRFWRRNVGIMRPQLNMQSPRAS